MISPSFGLQCRRLASSWKCRKHMRSSWQYTKISRSGTSGNRYYSIACPEKSDPLRILFCGSDEFSCASLNALHREHQTNPNLIKSLDVVVRTGKPTGRGMKVIRQPPLLSLATSLGLTTHHRDTFTGWNMPPEINLIIAVSFGLFVPPRLLSAAKYGGLNVHPSLLPDLRGPAPLQHTLLQGRQFTGVTLQTLDTKVFDHGLILSQTPAESMPLPENCSFQHLHDIVTPAGASLLVQGLRDGLHISPQSAETVSLPATDLQHAPKIRKEDKQVTPENLDNILRAHRAIGPLWFYTADSTAKETKSRNKRVIIQDLDGDMSTLSPLSSSSSSTASTNESSSKHEYTCASLPLANAKGDITHVNILFRKSRAREPSARYPEVDEDDLNYIYLPDQGCRIKQVTVEGGKAALPARIALGKMIGDSR